MHVSVMFNYSCIQMSHWFIVTVHVISTCAATNILYVLPDNVSDINCPSQPCATLGQYLLDNGSLPVFSDVEYYFLPGEHHVVKAINLLSVVKFSLIGFGLLPAKLVCLSQSYISILYSYNVTIKNLVFNQCSGDLFFQFDLKVAVGLLIYECSHCKIEDVSFIGYGLAGINLLQSLYINNISIDVTIVTPSVFMCNPKFVLMFKGEDNSHTQVSISINKFFISGHNEICHENNEVMNILLYNKHNGIHIKLCNSWFYNMSQKALHIQTKYSIASLLIKNCTFGHIKHALRLIDGVVNVLVLAGYQVTLNFENCKFYYNTFLQLLRIEIFGFCVHPFNVKLENCDFVSNSGSLLYFLNYVSKDCTTNVFFNELINFAGNEGDFIMFLDDMAVNMNGTINVVENNINDNIMTFHLCSITFAKTIIFLSNICDNVIEVISEDSLYILLMKYANVTFINTTYHDYLVFGRGSILDDNFSIFPYCIFQYMMSKNDKYELSELIRLYTINFSGNKHIKQHKQPNINEVNAKINNNFDFLTHCKWLPTAAFNGHNPGHINQQIIQVDGHQWIHHKELCYCPYDGDYNCTVDLLGPVYPGQKLQVDLCIPQADKKYIVFTETHAFTLPNSTCQLADQTEFINSIGNESKTYKFTFNSVAYKVCELFITSYLFFRTAFYVQLSPCPIGFKLQYEVCDCDPFLPPDIDTCYIDLSAIRRPANTWITAHTLTNNTNKYIISVCPMDYCIPYSTNVNLAHPDSQCQFSRSGILCSQCQHPLSMVFGSSRCMKCTNVHILITIIVIVAGIVLVVLLYVLNLTVTIGTINGIIFYANIVSINDSVFLVNDNVFKPLRVFISFTNLDLGIETCFYNGMDSYAKMWLQLFFPSYLIIIAISIIIASRYSSRMLRLTYSRSLPVLATLFLLSYTGVLRVVLTVLFSYSTITEYPSGDKQIVWSIDASVPLFGLKFTVLFIICLLLLLLLIPFNITLLFTRYLSKFRAINHFKPLLDAFQGSYKDKYYYWIALHLMFRSIFFSLYVFQVKLRLILANIILVVFTSYHGYVQPYKNKIVNFQELSMLVNLTILYAVSIQDNEQIFSVITNIMMSLALLQFGIIVVCHFLVFSYHCKFSIKEILMTRFNKWKSNQRSFDVALLNIPDRTYNYNEYQDGLVSDDFL